MNPHLATKSRTFLHLGLAGLLVTSFCGRVGSARAEEPAMPKSADPILCGTLENTHGQVQMLDISRTQVLSILPKTGIPCGAWISVGGTSDSWAQVKHRDGYTIHIAPSSFLQVPDNHLDAKQTSESFVLYHGEALIRSTGGTPTLSLLTANARVKLQRGLALVIYAPHEEETQIIALENESRIENRYQTGTEMKVKEGEASSLNFKLLRVMPSIPKAVLLSSLREKLKSFPIDDQVHSDAIAAAYKRQERKFANILTATEGPKIAKEVTGHESRQLDHPGEAPVPGTPKVNPVEHRKPANVEMAQTESEIAAQAAAREGAETGDEPAAPSVARAAARGSSKSSRAPASTGAPQPQTHAKPGKRMPQKFPAVEPVGDEDTSGAERQRLMKEMSNLQSE